MKRRESTLRGHLQCPVAVRNSPGSTSGKGTEAAATVRNPGPHLIVGDPDCKRVVGVLSPAGKITNRLRNDVTLHVSQREPVTNASRKGHWFDCRVRRQGYRVAGGNPCEGSTGGKTEQLNRVVRARNVSYG